MFFKTEHLIVNALTLEDSKRFHEICTQKFVTYWMNDWDMSLKEVETLLEYFITGYIISDPEKIPYVIAIRYNDILIGICGFGPKEEIDDKIEICYFIDEKYTKHGYMSEVLPKAIEYYFNMTNRLTLSALVDEANIPSKNLLIKNGFTFLKTCNADGKSKSIYCRIKDTLIKGSL